MCKNAEGRQKKSLFNVENSVDILLAGLSKIQKFSVSLHH